MGARGHLGGIGVIGVEHRDPVRPLVADERALHLDVGVHRAVVVEVVRRHVGDHADLRAVGQADELPVADLEHEPILGTDLLEVVQHRHVRAVVPGEEGPGARARQHLVDEVRDRELPVGAGDPDDGAGTFLEEQVRHRAQRHPAVTPLAHRGVARMAEPRLWHKDDFRALDPLEVAVAPAHRDGMRRQAAGRLAPGLGGEPLMRAVELRLELFGPAHVVAGDGGDPVPDEEVDHGRAFGAGQAQDVDVLSSIPVQPGGGHQKTTVNPNSAAKAAINQNRVTVWVSVHPESSKWWWRGAMRKMRFPPVLLK